MDRGQDDEEIEQYLRRGEVPEPFQRDKDLSRNVIAKLIKAYLDKNLPIHTEVDGFTLLELALDIDAADLVEQIVKRGADINRFNIEGQTPLIFELCLVDNQPLHLDMAKRLLKMGANPNALGNRRYITLSTTIIWTKLTC